MKVATLNGELDTKSDAAAAVLWPYINSWQTGKAGPQGVTAGSNFWTFWVCGSLVPSRSLVLWCKAGNNQSRHISSLFGNRTVHRAVSTPMLHQRNLVPMQAATGTVEGAIPKAAQK
jgi:hypothetical protein